VFGDTLADYRLTCSAEGDVATIARGSVVLNVTTLLIGIMISQKSTTAIWSRLKKSRAHPWSQHLWWSMELYIDNSDIYIRLPWVAALDRRARPSLKCRWFNCRYQRKTTPPHCVVTGPVSALRPHYDTQLYGVKHRGVSLSPWWPIYLANFNATRRYWCDTGGRFSVNSQQASTRQKLDLTTFETAFSLKI